MVAKCSHLFICLRYVSKGDVLGMINLAYGTTTQVAHIIGDVLMPPSSGLSGQSLESAVSQMLPNLHRAQRVTIAVPDPTRPPAHLRVLPSLLPYLGHAEVTIIVACGAHGAPHPSYINSLQAIIPQAKVVVHDCDERNLVHVGTTSRGTPVNVSPHIVNTDLALGLGSVAIHPFAGFSGGPKAFVPGCAGRDTISRNHSLLTDSGAGPSHLTDNPLYQDLLEATSLLSNLLIINEALSPEGAPLGYYSGRIAPTHAEAAKLALQAAAVYIEAPYDLVVASCGGYPRDINLYQAVKALDMASLACRRGGKLILLAECREGIGSDLYETWAHKVFAEQEAMVTHSFTVGAHKSYLAGRVLKRLGQAVLVSSLSPETTAAMGFTYASSLADALNLVAAQNENRVAIVPFGTTTLPIVKP